MLSIILTIKKNFNSNNFNNKESTYVAVANLDKPLIFIKKNYLDFDEIQEN